MNWTPVGKRSTGRLKETWRRMVEKERNVFGWTSWVEAAQRTADRAEWRTLVHALCAQGIRKGSFRFLCRPQVSKIKAIVPNNSNRRLRRLEGRKEYPACITTTDNRLANSLCIMFKHSSLLRTLTHRTTSASLVARQLKRGLICSCTRFSAGKLNEEELTQEEMDKLQSNPYFGKYADKLKQLQELKPDVFQSKVDALEQEKKAKEEEGRKAAEEMKAELAAASAAQTKPKSLNSVMKVELLEDKTAEEITEIWKTYHEKKKCVFATIPTNQYDEMYHKLRQFPFFVYPIPRGTGYQYFYQQFSGQECHFTPLALYQLKQEDAPTCLTLTHYTELKESKGIVLMHGEPDVSVLSVYEAQLLALQIKMYYGVHSGLKFNLVRQFTNTPDHFRHMDLVKEFENYKKDSRFMKTGEY
ncbi:ATP synthase mitochondrial F1 complex assembly factor 1 [Lamellibrachia satsuma]|nr:ATP synthase mitochondrial F1 complex assembly factor 1 [Lamellibrachia satsuma]